MSQNPLTPPDCDLRDFPFMPLDVLRLRDSDISSVATGEEFRCAVLLWCASWHQIPAASLPDDDLVLAKLAGFGKVVKEWKKVKNGALRGWVKCSDGRLYHPVVAEKANEARIAKLTQRWKTECGRIKKYNQRNGTDLPYPDLSEFLSPKCPSGHSPNVPGDSKAESPKCPSGNGIQGTGIGTGIGNINNHKAANISESAGDSTSPPERSVQIAILLRKNGAEVNAQDPRCIDWANRGFSDDALLAALEKAKQRRRSEQSDQPVNAGLLDAILRDSKQARGARSENFDVKDYGDGGELP